MTEAKPFDISKREVWEAFKRVKANQGTAGVDGQSIEEFERRLADNLYKLWNRLSSGSYMPPPVRRVDIPKASGGTRPLGIPTVADRIAQEVVRRYLEPLVEPMFHPDSYGYRPGRSAIDAIQVARHRCWRYDWVVDIDIKGFFDSIDHELLLRAVRKHTTCSWALLYIERWLKAPAMLADGALVERERGTPQGGVISPLLANLFLHYAFDVWLKRGFGGVPFERYADDIICHCRSERQALALRATLERRFSECGLALHPEKTKIVYCKDTNRKGEFAAIQFDFLGYTFRPRLAKWRGGLYGVSFLPAASPKALKAIRQTVRGWSLQTRSDKALTDLARMFNPYIRGSTTTATSTNRRSIRRCFGSTLIYSGGSNASSSAFGNGREAQGFGWRGWSEHRRTYSLTGRFCMRTSERWEPYESRGSRTVLGARGGAIPPRDSLAVESTIGALCA